MNGDFYVLSPRQAWREVRGIGKIGKDLVRSWWSNGRNHTNGTKDGPHGPYGFFLPGLAAPGGIYRPFCDRQEAELSENRLSIIIPQIGTPRWNVNGLPLLSTFRRLEREYQKVRPVIVEGHSLGGIQAMWLFARHPEIKLAIAIASPIWNTTWILLQWYAWYRLRINPGDPPHRLKRMRTKLSDSAQWVSTISSREDPFAPPERCEIPGARNLIISEDNHSGMFLHPQVLHATVACIRDALHQPPIVPDRKLLAA